MIPCILKPFGITRINLSVVILLSVFFFLPVAMKAQADEPSTSHPEKIFLDGKEYTKPELINAFVESAFSESLWNDDAGKEAAALFAQRVDLFSSDGQNADAAILAKKYPWVAPYFHTKNNFPKAGVLSKWPGAVLRIGIDWPVYGLDDYVEGVSSSADRDVAIKENIIARRESAYVRNYSDVYKKLQDTIRDIAPDIEKASGVSVLFNEPFSSEEFNEGYARVRIVPVAPVQRQKNWFKFDKYSDFRVRGNVSSDHISLTSSEYILDGAVPFTPYTRAQVDGYLLLNADNSIGLAVCKVLPDMGDDMLRALITECLLRSMGLPDVISDSQTHLGLWNEEYNAYAKLVSLDGEEEALFGSPPNLEEIYKQFGHSREAHVIAAHEALQKSRKEQYKKLEVLPNLNKNMKPYLRASEYDKFMLSLLYCEHLKSGIDKYNAISILSSHADCWKATNK